MNRPLLRLLALLIAGPAAAQTQVPVQPPARPPAPPAPPAIAAATVERVVATLAADSLQGRASGTSGSAKAARFLAAEFARIGLQPLPGATSFEQTFNAYETRPGPARVTLNGAAVRPANVALIAGQARIDWSSPGAGRVVVLGPKANPGPEIGKLFAPTENTLVLLDTAHAAYFRRLAGRLRRARMSAAAPAGYSTVVVLTSGATATTPCRVEATATIRPVALTNVVGRLPGADPARARETVVFSAHYDHLGTLPAVNGDSIANGADDDASGTAAVVALAEYFRAQPAPARPLLFVAFTAEEIGGFGSRHFATQLDPAQVVAMFNIEMIGKQAEAGPGAAYITGYKKSSFGRLLNRSLRGSGARFVPDPYPAQQLFYRSDNATLARLGVPAHTISTSRMPADQLYHSVDDEIASLNLPNLTAVVQSIARSATGIVSGQHTPSRVKDAGQRK